MINLIKGEIPEDTPEHIKQIFDCLYENCYPIANECRFDLIRTIKLYGYDVSCNQSTLNLFKQVNI